MYSEIEESWSREQIASALRLAGAGVPVTDILQMMGVSPQVFSGWKAEYDELFDKLISRFSGPEQLSKATKTAGIRRTAYMSDCAGDEEIESELRACKLRYSIVENAVAIAGELLSSGKVLGNFQRPIYPAPPRLFLESSSTRVSPTTRSELSYASSRGVSEMKVQETDSSRMDHRGGNLLILVSAQILQQKSGPLQSGASVGEAVFSGVVSGEIDELRWRRSLAGDGQIDEPIILDVAVEYSLEGILDGLIDAIRIFYTSPIDALLLGNFLIQKSATR